MAISLTLLCLSSCSTATSREASPQQRSQLIEQLQEARQTDLANAEDTSLGADAAIDYMRQADKAEKAINDLNAGSSLSSSEISDALFVPPQHLSPEMRAELIKQLQLAKALDDERWHDNLGGWNPILTEDFNIQSMRAKRVINDLQTDSAVPWWEIKQALYVPDEAYY